MYKSNLKGVLNFFNRRIDEAMDECGRVGVEAIKGETPVDTGDLRDANKYSRPNFYSVKYENDMDYAAAVELGTYKMSANPFMRRGITNSLGDFTKIIVRNLKI